MAEHGLAMGVLQLVALALPAFAILLQLIVEAELSYTHYAVPVTTAGLILFLVGGTIVLAKIALRSTSTVVSMAVGIVALGMICMLLGALAIGLQTREKQFQTMESSGDD